MRRNPQAYRAKDKAQCKRDDGAEFERISGFFAIVCPDPLRHLNRESRHTRRHDAKKHPCQRCNESDRCRGIGAELADHGGIDVFHEDEANLRQNSG